VESKKVELKETENRTVVTQGWLAGGRDAEMLVRGYQPSVTRGISSGDVCI